jgi:DNA (cytosine-5)-methyltransferase 1
MRYLSLFSGIEAATVAWAPLGWECAAVSEIDPFCCALLGHHYPHVPNLGDVTKISRSQIEGLGPIDLVVFGSPCQDLSIAGKRAGIHGKRSGLFFAAMHVVRWSGARFALWENVPGAFSSNGGRDFAAVVGEMVGVEPDVPRRGWSNSGVALGPDGLLEWCVLDAQFFGIPQRRRRIFALRDSGNWAGRPAILLEPESLRGNPPAGRKAKEEVAGTLGGGAGERGWCDDPDRAGAFVAMSLNAKGGSGRLDGESETFVTHALRGEGFDASEDGTGRGTPLVAFTAKDYAADAGQLAPTLRAMPHAASHANGGGQVAVCVQEGQTGVREYATAGTVRSDAPGTQPGGSLIWQRMAVRRLLPVECERLQGLADNYTLIPYRGKPASDGPRYRAIGNAMAVPVMRWIGWRIQAVDDYGNSIVATR